MRNIQNRLSSSMLSITLLFFFILLLGYPCTADAKRNIIITYDISGSMVFPERLKDDKSKVKAFFLSASELKAVALSVSSLLFSGDPIDRTEIAGLRSGNFFLYGSSHSMNTRGPYWKEGDGIIFYRFKDDIRSTFDSRTKNLSKHDLKTELLKCFPVPQNIPLDSRGLEGKESRETVRKALKNAFPGDVSLQDHAEIEALNLFHRMIEKGDSKAEVIWIKVSDNDTDTTDGTSYKALADKLKNELTELKNKDSHPKITTLYSFKLGDRIWVDTKLIAFKLNMSSLLSEMEIENQKLQLQNKDLKKQLDELERKRAAHEESMKTLIYNIKKLENGKIKQQELIAKITNESRAKASEKTKTLEVANRKLKKQTEDIEKLRQELILIQGKDEEIRNLNIIIASLKEKIKEFENSQEKNLHSLSLYHQSEAIKKQPSDRPIKFIKQGREFVYTNNQFEFRKNNGSNLKDLIAVEFELRDENGQPIQGVKFKSKEKPVLSNPINATFSLQDIHQAKTAKTLKISARYLTLENNTNTEAWHFSTIHLPLPGSGERFWWAPLLLVVLIFCVVFGFFMSHKKKAVRQDRPDSEPEYDPLGAHTSDGNQTIGPTDETIFDNGNTVFNITIKEDQGRRSEIRSGDTIVLMGKEAGLNETIWDIGCPDTRIKLSSGILEVNGRPIEGNKHQVVTEDGGFLTLVFKKIK